MESIFVAYKTIMYGVNTHEFVQEVGDFDTFNDSGHTECHYIGSPVHIQVENLESHCEGEAWQ